ncbi:hypothetical protein L9F63_028191, partial [Diploptera punctata]
FREKHKIYEPLEKDMILSETVESLFESSRLLILFFKIYYEMVIMIHQLTMKYEYALDSRTDESEKPSSMHNGQLCTCFSIYLSYKTIPKLSTAYEFSLDQRSLLAYCIATVYQSVKGIGVSISKEMRDAFIKNSRNVSISIHKMNRPTLFIKKSFIIKKYYLEG